MTLPITDLVRPLPNCLFSQVHAVPRIWRRSHSSAIACFSPYDRRIRRGAITRCRNRSHCCASRQGPVGRHCTDSGGEQPTNLVQSEMPTAGYWWNSTKPLSRDLFLLRGLSVLYSNLWLSTRRMRENSSAGASSNLCRSKLDSTWFWLLLQGFINIPDPRVRTGRGISALLRHPVVLINQIHVEHFCTLPDINTVRLQQYRACFYLLLARTYRTKRP